MSETPERKFDLKAADAARAVEGISEAELRARVSETPGQMTAEQRDGLREQLEGRLRGSFDEGDSGDYWLHQVLTESLQALSEVDRLTAKVAEQQREINALCDGLRNEVQRCQSTYAAQAEEREKFKAAEAKLRAVEALMQSWERALNREAARRELRDAILTPEAKP